MSAMRQSLITFLILFTGISAISGNIVKSFTQSLLKVPTSIWKKFFYLEPEVYLSLPEMVNRLGYPLETHKVTTEDGYILTNHRIPHGKNGQPADPDKWPVLLIHSSYLNSDSWLYNTPKNSLGFLLADAGFDVWMMNCRGNSYSRKHVTLNDKQAAYWDFRLDEVGYYDMAAFIDDVINKTGKQQVYLVGQSLGGGLPFVLLSSRPEYNVKVREIYALSPLGNSVRPRGPLSLVPKIPVIQPILKLLKFFGFHNLVTPSWIPAKLIGLFMKYADFLLKSEVFLIMGPSPTSWNSSRTPVFGARSNGGIPVNFLLQYAQFTNKLGLRHFDFGKKINMVKYNQSSPPEYDLKKVTAPTHLYYATNDYLVNKRDLEYLRPALANVVNDIGVAGHEWNHLAYFWGKDAGDFYNEVVASMVKNNAQT